MLASGDVFLFRHFAISLFRSPSVFVEYYTQALKLQACFTTRLVLKIAYDLRFQCSEEQWSDRRKESDQASRPISIGPLNGLLQLHAQPINQVVFLGS